MRASNWTLKKCEKSPYDYGNSDGAADDPEIRLRLVGCPAPEKQKHVKTEQTRSPHAVSAITASTQREVSVVNLQRILESGSHYYPRNQKQDRKSCGTQMGHHAHSPALAGVHVT